MNYAELVLGTVQFGCQYGINSAGRPGQEAVREILSEAEAHGISTLDTSSAYGDAETVLGGCLAGSGKFRIVSKYPQGSGAVGDVFSESLKRLGTSKLYGYLLHHFSAFKKDRAVWKGFLDLREKGLVEKIGFSLYSPSELEILLRENVDFSILQFPRNILDRSFDPYFKELKDRGVEIHVRSTFLQGLFFKDRETLPEKLLPLRKYLEELDEYARFNHLTMSELALNFNAQCSRIDGVLIGVDNREQLMANINALSDKKIDIEIKVAEQELLSPVNWN